MMTHKQSKLTSLLIIPFYNEEKRYRQDEFLRLLTEQAFDILFVNDGSNDCLPKQIRIELVSEYSNAKLIDLSHNSGKSEALRSGLIYAVERGYERVGFTDFDLSTPPTEIIRLMNMFQDEAFHANSIFGIRNVNYSSSVKTTYFREKQGKLFQKIANSMFGVNFQDLQCGMKIFSVSLLSREVLSEPFINQWLFELELLLRLPESCIEIAEVNLNQWNHFQNSKVKPSHLFYIVYSLAKLYVRYHKISSVRSISSL